MAGETGLGELGHLLWLIHSKTCLYCHLEFVFHVWYGWPNRISFISTETMHGGLHPPTALTSILKLRHILTQHIHGKSINHLSLCMCVDVCVCVCVCVCGDMSGYGNGDVGMCVGVWRACTIQYNLLHFSIMLSLSIAHNLN